MIRSHRRPAHAARKTVTRRLLSAVAVGTVLAGSAAVVGVANAESALVARFDYTMRERVTVDHRGAVTNLTPGWDHIHPNGWWVDLDACVSSPREAIANHHWEIELPDDVLVVDRAPDRCDEEVRIDAPQGSYRVTLTVSDGNGNEDTTTGTLTIKDHLIVSMGDSLASGEGNPDVPKYEGDLYWADRRCHRTGWTSPAQAARRIEESDRHSSVTFLSVACSGASIWNGLVGNYGGKEPYTNAGQYVTEPLEGQVYQVNKLLCNEGYFTCHEKADGRRIDTLIVSAGANDLHFSAIVNECAHPFTNPCTSPGASPETFPRLDNDLREFPTRLDYLADQFDTWLNYAQIAYPLYFDPTRNEVGDTCQEMHFEGGVFDGSISVWESLWASNEVIGPLNTHIQAAAQRANRLGRNWNTMRMSDRFNRNGYCTADSHRAIVRYDESFLTEGSEDGTMHPNLRGHQFYQEEIVQVLRLLLPA